MKTVIEMALQAGIFHEYDSEGHWDGLTNEALVGKDWLSSKEHKLKRIAEILTPFAELVRADEREVISEKNKPVIEQINKQMQELREAVLAENEACALIADEAEPYNAADLIRKRVKK